MIQITNPVWYFDASGSFVTKVKNQTMPLLYSVVIHDKQKKNILPIFEFLTTAHDATNIGTYLYRIKNVLSSNMPAKSHIIAPVVVVDFSRALINSVLSIFNNCSLDDYLKWSFDFIVRKNVHIFGVMRTKIFLCAAHIIKNVVKDYTKVEKTNRFSKRIKFNIKITFLHCFSLLQNSLSITEFNIHLKHTYLIFNSKKLTFFTQQSIRRMNRVCKEKMYHFEKNVFNLENEKKRDNHKKRSIHNVIFVTSKNNQSPFQSYFSNKIAFFSKTISHKNNIRKPKSDLLVNPYFCPSLFKIILAKLPLLPLWTGIIIPDSLNQTISRQVNNPVENYFDNLRNNILGISKKIHNKTRMLPSEMLTLSYKWLNAKFKENYEQEYLEKYNKTKKTTSADCKEKWSTRMPVQKKRTSYYDNNSYIGKLADTKSDDEMSESEFGFSLGKLIL